MKMAAFTLKITDGIAVITFNLPKEKVNILSPKVMAELEKVLAKIEDRPEKVKGAVIRSGKEGNFIAGADLSLIEEITDPAEGARLAAEGQRVLERIEALPFPVVAAIDGACLGGGLELALACRFRVASDSPKTALGLPETQLGIIPGFGGTQRLPRLVGLPEALKIILSGSRVYPGKARHIGLVDDVVPREHLMDAARRLIRVGKRRREKSKGRIKRFFQRTPVARRIIFERARKSVIERTGGHYPAQPAAIEAMEEGVAHGMKKGLEKEARLLGEMAVTGISKNLIKVFYLREMFSRGDLSPAEDIRNVAVIGAGAMGGGIAALAAEKGMKVRLMDLSGPALGAAIKRFNREVDKRRRTRRYTGVQAEWTRARFLTDTQIRGLGGYDLAIEAVAERMDVKKSVFSSLAGQLPETALMLSNTSSLSISEMGGSVSGPSRVAGLHFFNPVERMPLVEVIRGKDTSEETIMKVTAFALRLGKIAVVVKDAPGFLVNRLLLPYMNEATRLLEEGAGVETVDHALLGFGMPMGAFILLDQVGLDIAAHAGENLQTAFGSRMSLSPILPAMLEAGRLGKKAGKGFYSYDNKGERKPDPGLAGVLKPLISGNGGNGKFTDEEMVDRLILPMINEASRCLEEGVVDTPEAVDAAMIFGAGFPPFTAGPLRYADARGIKDVVSALKTLAKSVDKRFAPSNLLKLMAREKKSFYG
ncbi:fatty acid oxidation complex subunit alpha [bacterium BMS3Abin14]|nr:fatty acid oxidation complex subunit alpha [bacterium BMS3Abin14]